MVRRRKVLAEEMLSEANHQLRLYRKTKKEIYLRQACEKGWGASVQAVFKELGRSPRTHKDSMDAFETLALRRKDDFIARMGATADGLHSCFYHGNTPPHVVELSLKDVQRLINRLKSKRRST